MRPRCGRDVLAVAGGRPFGMLPSPWTALVVLRYVLASVRDYDTAAAFLRMVERFEGYAAAHGTSAEGNPSGGNIYRGLYNIALKSLGV